MALKFEITGDNSNLLSSLDGAREGVHRAAQDIESSGLGIEDMFKRIGIAAGVAFSADQVKSFIGKITEVRAYFQDIESSMEVFLGSQQKAAQFTQELKDYAYYNMFEFSDLANASKQMIAYGNAVEDVILTLDKLSNIATGTKADLMDLVALYNKAKSLGKVGASDLDSWAVKGVVVRDVLKEMGDEVDDTAVSFEQLQKVLNKVTGEGGMFHDLMLNQMSNISAEQGQLEDNLAAMYNEIGEQYQDFITGAIKAESWLVEHYKEVGSVILGLIASYGEYQAALKVTRAIENTMAKQANGIEQTRQSELSDIYGKYSDNSDIMAIGQETAAEEANTAAILQNTASREGNVSAIDEQIAALERKMLAEIDEYDKIMEGAQSAIEAATKKEDAADKEIEVLQRQADTAREYLDMCNDDVDAAIKSGDAQEKEAARRYYNTAATEAENAEKALSAAQSNKEQAASAKLTAQKNLETASSRKVATQEKLTNFQKAVSVTQTKAQTTATGLWVAMTKSATAALHSLKAAMLSNPFGVILAGLTTIISLLPIFTSEASEASAEVERFGESAVKQVRNLETLFAVIENTNTNSKVHKDAVDELVKIYEEYGFKIDDEIDKLEQLRSMHDLVTEAIKKEGEERQKANLLAAYEEALEEATTNMRNALQNAFENAEWDASGTFDDWDAEEYQEMAKELTAIIGGIIQSEGDALATLEGDELEAKIQEVNERIKKAYQDMGLQLSKEFIHAGANGQSYTFESPVDVDAIQIMRDYVDATHAVTEGRKKLIESWDQGKKSVENETEAVDYSTMSIEDLAKAAADASDKVTDLGDSSASPSVDKTSIDDAGDAASNTKTGIDLLNGLTAKPLIDSASIGIAIGQTNQLLGNMFQIGQMGGGQSSFSLGFNPNKFGFGQSSTFSLWGGKKPIWGTIGGKSGIQWVPNIPITDPAILAQQELNSRVNGANTQKKVDDLLKDVNDALSKAVFDSPEYKELEGLKKRLEAKSRKGNKKSGNKNKNKTNTAEKIADEQEKLEDMQDDLAFERLRSKQDMEARIADATIAAEQDAAKRVRMNREQQNAEEIRAIEKQSEDAVRKYIEEEKRIFEQQEKIKKLQNSKYKKQKFDESTVDTSAITAQYQRLIDLTKQRQFGDIARENAEAMTEYMKQYGSLQDQKRAVNEEYERKIADESNAIRRAALEKERDDMLEALDFQQLQEEIDWEAVFNDLDRLSTSSLQALHDKLKAALDAGDITAENAKVISEKLLEIEDKISDKTSFWGSLIPALKERERLTRAAKAAQEEYNRLVKEQEAAEQKVVEAQQKIHDEIVSLYGQDIDLSKISVEGKLQLYNELGVDATTAAGQQLTEAFGLLETATIDLTKAEEDAKNGKKKSEDAKNLLNGGSIGDIFKKAQEAGGGGVMGITSIVNQNAQSMAEFVDKIGLAGTDFGDAVHGFSDGVAGFSNAFQSLASGDIFGAINGVLDGIAGFGRSFISIFAGNGNEEEMEKRIEELAKANEGLSSAIDSLAERIASSDTTNRESVEAYKQAFQAEQEWESNQREAINARASEYANSGYGFLGLGGKRSFNYYMAGNGWEGWKTLSQTLKEHGENVNVNKDNFWSLTPEQMKILRDFAPSEWAALMNGDGHRNPVDLVNQYIDRAGKLEEITSALNEKLTGYSWDGFRDSFGSLLTDMSSDVEDFADNMENVLSKAILNSLLTAKYKDRIDALYKMIADAAMDDNITKEEADAIRNTNKQIAEDMLADRQMLQDLGIIDSNGSEYSQEASKKGFAAMGQETAEELNGRFTALQIAGETIAAQAVQIYGQMIVMSQVHVSSNSYLSEIRNMMITANSYLEDVAKYSKKMYLEFTEKLDDLVDNTKNM